MVCYHPLSAIKLAQTDGTVKVKVLGKAEWFRDRYISPDISLGDGQFYQTDYYIELPCGQCIGCRLERSRQWAVRCVHEASLWSDNCFLTLTYDDVHLPAGGSLVKKDLQDFWKRLRKAIYPAKLRYFACGEYGSQFERPHYHACVFGWSPSDKKLYTIRCGSRLYLSDIIAKCWPFGFHTIGDVSFDSAAYVARYVLKKINGDAADDHYCDREPEYVVMSRKPGIAKDWILNFYSDVYPHDYVVIRDNIKCRPPRYYDQVYDLECNGDLDYIKNKRADPKFHKSYSFDRLHDMENFKIKSIKSRKKRKYEENI